MGAFHEIVAIANQKGGCRQNDHGREISAPIGGVGEADFDRRIRSTSNATSSFVCREWRTSAFYEPLLGEASITEKDFPTRREDCHRAGHLDMAGAEVEIARCKLISRAWRTLKRCIRIRHSISFPGLPSSSLGI